MQNKVDAVVIDNAYLLVYTVGEPWYSKNSKVFHEDLVLRIGKGSSFSRVIYTIEALANYHRCSAIIVGGALARSSQAIVRLYESFGYTLETNTPSLTKRGN